MSALLAESPDIVDALVVVVPAGIVVAVLALIGYRVKKEAAKRRRVAEAHRPPTDNLDG